MLRIQGASGLNMVLPVSKKNIRFCYDITFYALYVYKNMLKCQETVSSGFKMVLPVSKSYIRLVISWLTFGFFRFLSHIEDAFFVTINCDLNWVVPVSTKNFRFAYFSRYIDTNLHLFWWSSSILLIDWNQICFRSESFTSGSEIKPPVLSLILISHSIILKITLECSKSVCSRRYFRFRNGTSGFERVLPVL